MLPKSHVRHFSLNITYFLVGVLVLLSMVSHCRAKMWRGIVPFHSYSANNRTFRQYPDVEGSVRYTGDSHANGKRVLSSGDWQAAVDRYLSCLESLTSKTQSIPIFEQYGMISLDSEKAILDNFAIQLLDNQDLTGYVVLRRGQYSPKLAARKLRYIRAYLTKRRGVPASRVSVFEGKHRRDFSIELYLVSKGKPGPN